MPNSALLRTWGKREREGADQDAWHDEQNENLERSETDEPADGEPEALGSEGDSDEVET